MITLVATDEPGGMGWLGNMLEYASTMGPGKEGIVVLNKLSSIRGGNLDIGVKNVVKILRNPAIEAAWRLAQYLTWSRTRSLVNLGRRLMS